MTIGVHRIGQVLFFYASLIELAHLVCTHCGPESDINAVITIDGNDGDGEIHQFCFGKMFSCFFIDIIRDDTGGKFGSLPRQGLLFPYPCKKGLPARHRGRKDVVLFHHWPAGPWNAYQGKKRNH